MFCTPRWRDMAAVVVARAATEPQNSRYHYSAIRAAERSRAALQKFVFVLSSAWRSRMRKAISCARRHSLDGSLNRNSHDAPHLFAPAPPRPHSRRRKRAAPHSTAHCKRSTAHEQAQPLTVQHTASISTDHTLRPSHHQTHTVRRLVQARQVRQHLQRDPVHRLRLLRRGLHD